MKADSRTGALWWLPRILGDTDLDATDTLLMVALAEHIGPDDRTIVGIARLADGARCSYPTAKRRLADLEERGYIERERRRRGDGNMSTYETFLLRAKYDEPGINMIPDQGSPRRALTRDHLDDPAELPRSDELPSNAQARLLPEHEQESDGDNQAGTRDLIFEALAEVSGIDWKGGNLTRSERGMVNRAAKELREVGATPEGIRARADVYRRRWPGIDLTPTALVKHYSRLGSSAAGPESGWDCPIPYCSLGYDHDGDCDL